MSRCCPAWKYATVGIALVGLTNKPYTQHGRCILLRGLDRRCLYLQIVDTGGKDCLRAGTNLLDQLAKVFIRQNDQQTTCADLPVSFHLHFAIIWSYSV